MLSPLLRKATADAGFDLELGEVQGWQRIGLSGAPGAVWVRPVGGGAALAVTSALVAELGGMLTAAAEPPPGAAAVVDYPSAAALFEALRRIRVLLAKGPAQLEARWQAKLAMITSTDREAVVRQRVGQALFRDALLDYWDGHCAATGLAIPELLRASHVKPWKSATDAERLDVHNGLLLAAHLDALFDQGFLTFGDNGEGQLSPQVDAAALQALGLSNRPVMLARVSPAHAPYLAYHRTHVFRSG